MGDQHAEPTPDLLDADGRWIPPSEYRQITSRVPIVCVDVLPESGDGKIGLILRNTVSGQQGWCLIGGAVLLNETLIDAIRRHVGATVPGLALDETTLRLCGVFEYFTDRKFGDLVDPRKHAVAVTYRAVFHGTPIPRGEAIAFQWYSPSDLPATSMGFDHDLVVAELMRNDEQAN